MIFLCPLPILESVEFIAGDPYFPYSGEIVVGSSDPEKNYEALHERVPIRDNSTGRHGEKRLTN